MSENSQSVESIFQILSEELQKQTQASRQNCQAVASRINEEVQRICRESPRIQASGEIEVWGKNLGQHRLQQCLRYYRLGSNGGRLELHSTLSAMVYRYITPPQLQSSYQARLDLIRDFLQGFYLESLNAFRRETLLTKDYTPRTLLELAEYMAFTERYAKRRISLPRGRHQQLIILRAQTFSQQQPHETSVDIEKAAEGVSGDGEYTGNDNTSRRVRESMVLNENPSESGSLRQTVIRELIAYFQAKNQSDCADYFILRLQDLPTQEIEAILGLTPRQRDYLQQRFKYHLLRFALGHHWELVHEWLEADLERNLGLSSQEWLIFLEKLNQEQKILLGLKQKRLSEEEIGETLQCTVTQVQKRWFKLLEIAWEVRNHSVSGLEALENE